jgi:hypothetical protein
MEAVSGQSLRRSQKPEEAQEAEAEGTAQAVDSQTTGLDRPAGHLQRFLDRLKDVRPRGPGKWVGRCPHPNHLDERPSLQVTLGDNGKVIFNCFVCCPPAQDKATNKRIRGEILDKLGLTWADLKPGSREGYVPSPVPTGVNNRRAGLEDKIIEVVEAYFPGMGGVTEEKIRNCLAGR